MKKPLKEGQRVAWKSGKEWKTGTVLFQGNPNQEPQLPKEFSLAYRSRKNKAGPHYYVAADTPLFQPGYLVHCVPLHHLQREETSKPTKIKALEKMSRGDLLELAFSVLESQQKLKAKFPFEIAQTLHKLNPENFPLPKPLPPPKKCATPTETKKTSAPLKNPTKKFEPESTQGS